MEVHRDVDALLFNELGHAVAHFLGESAIGTPRVGAVDIPGLGAGQPLSGGGVDVDLRVGPLVDGVGGPGAEAEPALPVGGVDGKAHGGPLLGVSAGEGAVVGPRDDVQGARLRLGVLNEQDGGHQAGRLIGVGAPQHQHGVPLLLPLQHIDLRVSGGSLQTGIPVGQHLDLCHSGAGVDGLHLPHGEELAGQIHDGGGGQSQQDQGG